MDKESEELRIACQRGSRATTQLTQLITKRGKSDQVSKSRSHKNEDAGQPTVEEGWRDNAAS